MQATMQRSVESALERMGRAPGRPAAMAPFEELFAGGRRGEELAAGDQPVVGVLCNFAPEELILAAGAVPVRLDLGHAACVEAGGAVIGNEVCPTVRAIVGARAGGLGLHGRVDLLVVPAACDAKKKLPQLLSDGLVHLMELPHTKDGMGARERWYEQVFALARRLEKLCGGRIRRGELRGAVELLNRRTKAYRRLLELRWARPGLLNGRDTMLVAQASFIADPAWWVERAEALVVELEGAAPSGAGGTPLLFSGSPIFFPDFNLLHLLEEAGAEVVADETCAGTQRLYNPTVLDEGSVRGMVRAVADKALLPCTCPCLVGGDDRVNRVLELYRRGGARGVVLHTLRLCCLYELDQPGVAAALEARGIPVMVVSTEAGSGEIGPLRTRVEAFLEMLDS